MKKKKAAGSAAREPEIEAAVRAPVVPLGGAARLDIMPECYGVECPQRPPPRPSLPHTLQPPRPAAVQENRREGSPRTTDQRHDWRWCHHLLSEAVPSPTGVPPDSYGDETGSLGTDGAVGRCLNFTSEGGLLLHDGNGTMVWSTATKSQSIAGMDLDVSGNLVLFNQDNSSVWQSFDHPTDTLVMGQSLCTDAVEAMKLAMWCLQVDSSKRPLMSTIAKVLEGVMSMEAVPDCTLVPSFASNDTVGSGSSYVPSESQLSGPRNFTFQIVAGKHQRLEARYLPTKKSRSEIQRDHTGRKPCTTGDPWPAAEVERGPPAHHASLPFLASLGPSSSSPSAPHRIRNSASHESRAPSPSTVRHPPPPATARLRLHHVTPPPVRHPAAKYGSFEKASRKNDFLASGSGLIKAFSSEIVHVVDEHSNSPSNATTSSTPGFPLPSPTGVSVDSQGGKRGSLGNAGAVGRRRSRLERLRRPAADVDSAGI
nr:unnamed protein product [Digitaria exilis]